MISCPILHKAHTAYRAAAAALVCALLCLLLPCHAAAQQLMVEVFTDRTVIPEGSTASILIKAASFGSASSITVNLRLSGTDHERAVLSASAAELTAGITSERQITVSVADNQERQGEAETFSIMLEGGTNTALSSTVLNFTIPPNDLNVLPKTLAGTLRLDRTISLSPERFTIADLQDTKTFVVSSLDTRINVQTGIITTQDPFSVLLRLREDRTAADGEVFNLTISHLDAFSRNSAEISAKRFDTCAIKTDGTLTCWGGFQINPAASMADQNTRFLALGIGGFHGCAIKTDGTMVCDSLFEDENSDPTSSPQGVSQNTRFLAVSSGEDYTCAIKEDGTMACWGESKNNRTNPRSSLQGIDQNTRFLAVGTGNFHSCAIKTDGTMACWGDSGQDRTNPISSPQVDQDTRFLAVSAGGSHSCGIKTDGTLTCWGSSGNNRTSPTSSLHDVSRNTRFLAVGAGEIHNCAIKMDRTMACWGDPSDGKTNPSTSTQGVSRNTRFLAVSAGSEHSCAVKMDRTLACWGDSESGKTSPPAGSKAQIIPDAFYLYEKSEQAEVTVSIPPIGVFTDRPIIPEGSTASILIKAEAIPSPTLVSLRAEPSDRATLSASSIMLTPDKLSALIEVSVADNQQAEADSYSFSIHLDSMAKLSLSRLDFTVPPNDLELRVQDAAVFSFSDAARTIIISAAPDLQSSKTFAVSFSDSRLSVPDSFIMTHNQNPFPMTVQFKEGARPTEFLDLTISHLDSFSRDNAKISTGFAHNCAIKTDGTMACWGDSGRGQTTPTSSPQGINQNTRFLAVSAGHSHSCAIKIDGTMACWGDSSSGQTNPSNSPQGVNQNTRFLAVSAGKFHACAIKTDHTMACWGWTDSGRTDPSDSPQGVDQNTRFLAVDVGYEHTCAIKTDNTVACWGFSSDRRTDLTSGPQAASRNTRFLAVGAGDISSCAVKIDGTMACWGDSFFGDNNPSSSQGVDQNTRFLAVSTGGFHSCGIKTDGTLACWGNSGSNQTSPTSSLHDVSRNTRFLAVSAGHDHSCGIKEDGSAACWGKSDNGQTNPPAGFKAQIIPDTFYLFEQEQVLADAVRRATEIEVLHPELRIGEGETTKLTLFRATESLNKEVAITMRTMNNDSVMLDLSTMRPAQFMPSTEVRVKLSMTDLSGEVTITAVDDESYSSHEPVVFTLLVDDENIPLLPAAMMKITVVSDEFHTLGFSTATLTLEEGSTSSVKLSMMTEPAQPVTITLMSPAADHLKFIDGQGSPRDRLELIFSAEQKKQNVILSAERDEVLEPRRNYPISVSSEEELRTSTPLTVVIPAQSTPLMTTPNKLRLKEGESAELRFSITGSLAEAAAVVLTVQGDIMIRDSLREVILEGQDAVAAITVTAVPDGLILSATRSASISLNTSAETITLPQPIIPIIIENNEFYTVAFSAKTLRLREGSSAKLSLDVDPPLPADSTVKISLAPSDTGTISIAPAQATFMAGEAQTSKQVTITALKAGSSPEASIAVIINEVQPAGLKDLTKAGDDLIIMIEALAVRVRIKVYLEGALP